MYTYVTYVYIYTYVTCVDIRMKDIPFCSVHGRTHACIACFCMHACMQTPDAYIYVHADLRIMAQ